MRITKPRDWNFLSEEKKQEWAEKQGKAIKEAKRICEQRVKEMEKNGEFERRSEITYEAKTDDSNRMVWFKDGIF